jgi:hypothetical protein
MSRLVLLSLFLLSQSSYAFEQTYFVGLGLLSKNVAALATADSGETGLFTSNFFQLVFSGIFKISDEWAFAPSLTFTPLGASSPENGEVFRVFTIAPKMGYDLGSSWDIHFGPGLFVYQIYGGGGTATVNNGGTPVNFPLPNSTAHTFNFMADLGVGFEKDSMRFELDVLMTGLINRRTTNIILSFIYGFS